MHSIFEGWILFILRDRQYVRGVNTANIKLCVVFPAVRYSFHKSIRSIFEGWILLILSDTKYFRTVDTAYIKLYAVL